MDLDPERCAAIVERSDPRFDGWLYVGVTSTGIYCRPSCAARPPRRSNMTFHPSAAAAQRAGFRACKRCRPDAAPGSPEWDTRADTVGRALRLITDGVVDRDGVGGLASRLGYSERHLGRLLTREVGAGPLALARAQRARTARVLIETTGLPLSDVAFAAGFDSIRQFNDTIRGTFAITPTALRARHRQRGPGQVHPGDPAIHLRLAVRQPFDHEGLLDFLAARAIVGVESIDGSTFRRSIGLPGGPGIVELDVCPDHVAARFVLTDLADLAAAIARCRRLLDLDSDPEAIDGTLTASALLGPSVERHPGRRVPGAMDGWELAARAVVGQQVSVKGARTVLGRIAAEYGAVLASPGSQVTAVFPTADRLAALDPASLPLPAARAETLVALAARVASGRLVLDAGADWEVASRDLRSIRGIGAWTADYVRMRALHDPDVLLADDLVIRRQLDAAKVSAAEIDGWRPWRSSASMHLWALASEAVHTTGARP